MQENHLEVSLIILMFQIWGWDCMRHQDMLTLMALVQSIAINPGATQKEK